ncbi:MAG: rhodanese-like domain-containing protein [Solirubrobacteraceae bacterium]
MSSLEISAAEAARMLAEGAQLVDVREPYEREVSHIDGSIHIELSHLSSRARELDSARPVIFQCRVGARSSMAAAALAGAGYEAYTLSGGLLAWVAAGLPLVPEGAPVADH